MHMKGFLITMVDGQLRGGCQDKSDKLFYHGEQLMTKKEQTSAIVKYLKKCNFKDFFSYVELVKTKNEKNLAVFWVFQNNKFQNCLQSW